MQPNNSNRATPTARRNLAAGAAGLLLLALPLAAAPPRYEGAVVDPARDTLYPLPNAIDAYGLSAELVAGALHLRLTHQNAGAIRRLGFIDLDIDAKRATGAVPWTETEAPRGTGLGMDLYLNLWYYHPDDGRVTLFAADGTAIARVPMRVEWDYFEITVPAEHLGGATRVAVAAVIGAGHPAYEVSDLVPDRGAVVAVPRPPGAAAGHRRAQASAPAQAGPSPYQLHSLAPVQRAQGTYRDLRFVGLADDGTLVAWARGARPPAPASDATRCRDFAVRFHPRRGVEVIQDASLHTQPMAIDPRGAVYGMTGGGEGACLPTAIERRAPFRFASAARGFELLTNGATSLVRSSLQMVKANRAGQVIAYAGPAAGKPPVPFLYEPATGWNDLRGLAPGLVRAVPVALSDKGELAVVARRAGGLKEATFVDAERKVFPLGHLGYPITVVTALARDGRVYGCSHVTREIESYFVLEDRDWGILSDPIGSWWSTCTVGVSRSAEITVARRGPEATAVPDLVVNQLWWSRLTVPPEALAALLPAGLELRGWRWVASNDSSETVGVLEAVDPSLPAASQRRDLPFYHHPRLGGHLLSSLLPAGATTAPPVDVFAINAAGTIALAVAAADGGTRLALLEPVIP